MKTPPRSSYETYVPYGDSPPGSPDDLEFMIRCQTLWALQRGETAEAIAEQLEITIGHAEELVSELKPVVETMADYAGAGEGKQTEAQKELAHYKPPHAVLRTIRMKEFYRQWKF